MVPLLEIMDVLFHVVLWVGVVLVGVVVLWWVLLFLELTLGSVVLWLRKKG
jgi:phosphatidylglycerophosphate synthase